MSFGSISLGINAGLGMADVGQLSAAALDLDGTGYPAVALCGWKP
jgi:hypothetical protein